MPFEPTQFSMPEGDASGHDPLRITLDTGRFAGQSFEAVLHVCTNPNCICSIVQMDCTPPSEPPPDPDCPRWPIDLDVIERTVKAADDAPSAACELARAIGAEMDDAAWKWFYDYFREIKARITEETDPDTIEIDVPVDEIEEGLLIGYDQVFPWAEEFRFSVGADQWLALDAYCLRPSCRCAEAGLQLFRITSSPSRAREPQKLVAFLYFDYRTGRARIDETRPGCPPLRPVITALRKAYPALARRLQERHAKLRRIALRSLERSGSAAPTPNQPPSPPPPVGRNDPCPCGSGRKFKKCCGSGG